MIYHLPNAIDSNSKYIITDSRNVLFPNESIFFALKGVNYDGHKFLKDLYYKGVREFVIEQASASNAFLESISFFENSRIWIVSHAITSLQNLVETKRKEFNLAVIAITGSNGKTIVKEWLSQMLGDFYSIIKSPKSYNSQLGVPLSVWQINATHNLGIFEAGISKVNEMENLEKVIKPTIGIFTNIGSAHDEFFNSRSQKIKEKLKLFKNTKQLIYCRDNALLDKEINDFMDLNNKDCQLLSWSLHDDKPNSFKSILNNVNNLSFFDGDSFNEFKFPIIDEASIQNVCHCIILMKSLGLKTEQIRSKLAILKPVEMRLELKEGIHLSHLIDDSYNNDFIGLKLAVEFLNQQKQHPNKILILSDILQTGEDERVLYKNISKLIEVNNINQLYAIGPIISKNADLLPKNTVFFPKTDSFLEEIPHLLFNNSTILIKGARAFAFEKIVKILQAKNHDTYLEINLDAIISNLNYFKQKIQAKTRIMAMVKAFAYGSGNKEVASLLQHQGIDYLGVAYSDEGIFLRENGINLPIMVMNPTVSDFRKIIENSLEPEIYSMNKLVKFADFMETQNGFAKIHIKLDTGMHRLGFRLGDIEELLLVLKKNPNILIASIFSHLVASDDANQDNFTRKQVDEFKKMATMISNSIGYNPLQHILNSAGISRFQDFQMDMVRLGVGLYGIGASKSDKEALIVVGTLKSSISQIKEIETGETVGYNRKGMVTKKSKIATIAIGYADGYSRRFGNGIGSININGKLCPTIGNICMDMTMVDVTSVEAKEGDEVTVFGYLPTAYDLAQQIGTIPYEILTNIGERVKRVFYKI